ncbi:hypothetical protein BH11BAC1_BH11BAC1_03340 [soil metagenome]
MKYFTCVLAFIFISTATCFAQLPQKYDNLYKTIFAKDFCAMVQQNPKIVLLDVRSAGEFCDTSAHSSLNMGHLKGAVNIEIDSIKKNITVMDKYRDSTLIIYCSHSQRSRRISKLLTENGFTNFYNLNGGMSSINQMTEKDFPCKQNWVQSNVHYKNLSNSEALSLYNSEKKLIVLDARPASQFESKDSIDNNNIGKIKGAINIPYAELKDRIGELKKYSDRPILVYAATGDGDAARTANELAANGFKNVYYLMAGLHSLVASQKNLTIIENPLPFSLLDPVQTLALLKNTPGLIIYDTRMKEEFENKADKEWRNLGNIKGAINLNTPDFEKLQLPADRNVAILLYGHEEAFKLGRMLSGKGYTNVNMLEGFYDFVWSSFNVENCKEAKEFIVNHDGLF